MSQAGYPFPTPWSRVGALCKGNKRGQEDQAYDGKREIVEVMLEPRMEGGMVLTDDGEKCRESCEITNLKRHWNSV